MRNDDPTWSKTADMIDMKLDGILAIPLVAYGGGLFIPDAGLAAAAIAVWALAVFIWTPWVFLRVIMADKPGDGARALAILGYGLFPWLPFAFFSLDLSAAASRTGMLVAFPLLYLWGGGAFILVLLQRPALRKSPLRQIVLGGGAFVYALLALAFVLLLTGPAAPEALITGLSVLFAGLNAVAAGGICYALARESFPARRPR